MRRDNPLTAYAAEQALLGGLLLNPITFHDVSEIVSRDDFCNVDHGRIYKAIESLVIHGKDVDIITVSEIVENEKQGLFNYVTDITSNCAGSANVVAYAHIIRDRSKKRCVLSAANEIARYTSQMVHATADEVISFANSAFYEIDNRDTQNTEVMNMESSIKAFVAGLEERFNSEEGKLNGLSSGFDGIDFLTNGFKPGHLIILGGRPSMGKSTFALQTAFNISEKDKANGIFFSVEMTNDDLMQKLIACAGHLNLSDLENPKCATEDFWSMLTNAAGRVKNIKLKTVYCHGIDINQICAHARKEHRKEPLDYIVIDHLHAVRSDGENREREISKISFELKALAGQLKIPVIALAQLNRDLEKRGNKQPQMSDLRSSGSIEQDADLIFFIYRDDYYNEDESNPNKGLVQIELGKHRNGKIGKVCLEHRLDQSRFQATNRTMYTPEKGRGGYNDL